MPYISVSHGAEIFFEETGSGHPLLLLHGNGEDSSCFAAQIPAYSQKFRVISVDSRGHGRSTHGDAPLSIELMAEDAAAVIGTPGSGQAAVLGFSDGGNIALELASRFPELVSALVISGANTEPHGLRLKILREMEKQALAETDPIKKELFSLMTEQPHISKAQLRAIRCPTLVTAGSSDMIRVTHTRYIRANIARSRLYVFASSSHFTNTEMPELYNKITLDFLEECFYGKKTV